MSESSIRKIYVDETVRRWEKVWVETGSLKTFKWVLSPADAEKQSMSQRTGEGEKTSKGRTAGAALGLGGRLRLIRSADEFAGTGGRVTRRAAAQMGAGALETMELPREYKKREAKDDRAKDESSSAVAIKPVESEGSTNEIPSGEVAPSVTSSSGGLVISIGVKRPRSEISSSDVPAQESASSESVSVSRLTPIAESSTVSNESSIPEPTESAPAPEVAIESAASATEAEPSAACDDVQMVDSAAAQDA